MPTMIFTAFLVLLDLGGAGAGAGLIFRGLSLTAVKTRMILLRLTCGSVSLRCSRKSQVECLPWRRRSSPCESWQAIQRHCWMIMLSWLPSFPKRGERSCIFAQRSSIQLEWKWLSSTIQQHGSSRRCPMCLGRTKRASYRSGTAPF